MRAIQMPEDFPPAQTTLEDLLARIGEHRDVPYAAPREPGRFHKNAFASSLASGLPGTHRHACQAHPRGGGVDDGAGAGHLHGLLDQAMLDSDQFLARP